MNTPPPIKVMLSSRSKSQVFTSNTTLETIRRNLQTMLRNVRWTSPGRAGAASIASQQPVFEVWIHENEVAANDRTTLELSVDEIGLADIIIVLYTGEAGSVETDAQMGICYAELQAALTRRSDVVHIIRLLPVTKPTSKLDIEFQDYVKSQNRFQLGADINDEATLQAKVLQLLHKAVANLVKRGARGGRRRDQGLSLDWGRLELAARRHAMRASLLERMVIRKVKSAADGVVHAALARQTFCIRVDAIPAALTVPAARELVGQPFLSDHLLVDHLTDDAPGIIHLIACHRGVTESQASRILGTPDAITVASDFGVYAADHVQQIQLFFLAQCADEAAVAHAWGSLNSWLVQTKEITRVTRRAQARSSILQAVNTAGKLARGEDTHARELEKRTEKKRPKRVSHSPLKPEKIDKRKSSNQCDTQSRRTLWPFAL